MKIKSISVLKHPRESVWTTIRDRLPEIVPFLDDIESVKVQSRDERPDGAVQLVNLWKAKPKLPAIAANYIMPDMLAWIDRADYRPQSFECHWQMEPLFFSERIKCAGVTRYESAMGGRGPRVTVEGDLELSTHNLPGVPAILEGALASGVAAFVTALVPKNFRKLIDAVGQFMESPAGAKPKRG